MKAFKNEDIKDDLCGGCNCTGFAPNITFTYDGETGELVITDDSDYPDGDSRKIVQIEVRDKNGDKMVDNIAADDDDDAISIDTSDDLDSSGGLSVHATVVSDKGCLSAGHIDAIGINIVAGSLGYWDKDYDAIK